MFEEVDRYSALSSAAGLSTKVGSLTHGFYKYPARFGDAFVREAVSHFSQPGDLVLDPFCGGGTTIVEALANGRHAVGSDISPLAIFVTRAKTTPLSAAQLYVANTWVDQVTGSTRDLMAASDDAADARMDGLHQPFRNILSNLRQRTLDLPRGESRNFARCLLVKTAQWAFDGKEHLPTPTAFVGQISLFFDEMKRGMQDYSLALRAHGNDKRTLSERRWLLQCSAKNLAVAARDISQRAALVVTSPPYLGVHVLYNKWQLEGRRELRAPFFLVDQHDIGGAANYTIIDRKTKTHTLYYSEIEQSFRAVRTLLKPKAYVIQLVSFGEAESALPHYLSALNRSGLELCETYMRAGLQWRFVPGRRWYARVREVENSSANREVLLVHRKGGSE